MKFTFKSEHEYGTTVEMTFDEEHIDEIEEMFKLFLRGSGFHIPDEDMYTKQESNDTFSERVHGNDISATEDKTEISATADKPWVGLTDDEISLVLDKNTWASGDASWGQFAKGIEAALKERNT
jgi:hypothetical protein